jgi:prepilin signal peptidase PulO-like enzyme (type II secretory pathway)
MSGATVARAIMLLAAAACAVIDLRERRIPHAIVLPALAAVAGARLLEAARGAGWLPLADGLAAGAAAWLLFRLVRAASGGRLGAGDAQLAALIALALGTRLGLAAMLIASTAGTAAALVLIAWGRLRRSDPLAFAPFLALGAAGALIVEPQVARLFG